MQHPTNLTRRTIASTCPRRTRPARICCTPTSSPNTRTWTTQWLVRFRHAVRADTTNDTAVADTPHANGMPTPCWQCHRDFSCLTEAETEHCRIQFLDGIQSWVNPKWAPGRYGRRAHQEVIALALSTPTPTLPCITRTSAATQPPPGMHQTSSGIYPM